jgi:DNA-binding transcriptional regulator YiaG
VAVALNREALGSTVPRELVLLTPRSAARSAAGAIVPADLVSPSVSSITNGVMKTMFVNRLRLMIGSVLGLGLVGLGAAGFAQFPGQADRGQPPAIAVGGQPVPTDNFEGIYNVQPKPEKVAAKGIEDDDVPLPATPSQAVVRVEDGKLIVRQRTHVRQISVQEVHGQNAYVPQVKTGVSALKFDAAEVAVFDMKGNRMSNKQWRDKFKNDVHALVAYDGKLPNPREIRLKLGLNQQEFWTKVGVTQSGGSRYESGRSMPRPVRELLRLVHVEKIDIDKAKGEDFALVGFLKSSNPNLYKNLKKAMRETPGNGKAHRRAAVRQ